MVVLRRYETAKINYWRIRTYNKIIIQMYRDTFIGKFSRIETSAGQAKANATVQSYHDYLISKIGAQLKKDA